MKFLSVFKHDGSATQRIPSDGEIARMMELIGEMRAKGVLLDTGGVQPTGLAFRVARGGGNTTVTDGPFAESKEVVGGFCVFRVASRDEAEYWSRRFLDLAGDGATDLIEVTEWP